MARAKAGTGAASGPSEDTKARIIEAALASLHEQGIMGASARAIARRGDFNQALIFYHFGGVNELLLAAVDELSSRRNDRYQARLEGVSSLRELVALAGELHAEDMRDGHITVLTQMLAGATSDPALKRPLLERFQPWIDLVETSVSRVLSASPYGALVPSRDLALAITAQFIGLELLLNLEDDETRREHHIFSTFELLAGMLEAMLAQLPVPPAAPGTGTRDGQQ